MRLVLKINEGREEKGRQGREGKRRIKKEQRSRSGGNSTLKKKLRREGESMF